MTSPDATFDSSRTLLHQVTFDHATETSPNGTVYYSLTETGEEGSSAQKRQNEEKNVIKARKKYRHNEPDVPIGDWTMEVPNWKEHPLAWGFLQSQNPQYPSKYLEKADPTSPRAGYVLGRKADCDIVFSREDISKNHCLIYMETGANQRQKGIRIYIKDTSFNGTYVDGKLVGLQKRQLLRNGNVIQLVRPPPNPSEEKLRHKFYRILFPPSFESHTCESVYKFGPVLGSGNFAHVNLAVHRKTREKVAIKVLKKDRFYDKPKMLESFIEEVSIMMSLHQHPLVVQMKNIYNEVQNVYLVLDYIPGGELFSYVSRHKKLDEDTARFVFWQLLMATKYLHNANVAHRDLKPENILLVSDETLQIKISDFGLAKTEYHNMTFGSQCGTPNYVAPEILNPSECRSYNKQCDLWSLGVILYVCLCGYPPFAEENAPPSMKEQIKTGAFSFASPHWDPISDEAKDLIKHLLTVDPTERMNADEALDHDWLYMNPDHMEKMKAGLGKETIDQIMSMNNSKDNYSLTQIATQSQQV